jgi:NADH:ubiquinone oxidoreductase subunit E
LEERIMPEIVENKSLPNVGLYRRHKASIDALAAKYPNRRSMLLPVLWIIQEEDGRISPEMMPPRCANARRPRF